MTSISDEKQELYQERLAQQTQNNQVIFDLINQAKSDDKKYLPFGPLLMNIYNADEINHNKAVLMKNIEQAQKVYCFSKCNSQADCNNVCQQFFKRAFNFGMDHFAKIYKYSYVKTASEEQ